MAARLDKAIAALARKQHGYVTRRQLLALGLGRRGDPMPGPARSSDPGLRRRVRRRPPPAGPGIPRPRRRARVRGRRRPQPQLRRGAVEIREVTGQRRSRSRAPSIRRRNGLKTHRTQTLTRRDITRQLGVPVTSPARTVLDMAPRAQDRCRAQTVRQRRPPHSHVPPRRTSPNCSPATRATRRPSGCSRSSSANGRPDAIRARGHLPGLRPPVRPAGTHDQPAAAAGASRTFCSLTSA